MKASDKSRKTFRIRKEALISQLRAEIQAGTYRPGELLPSEEELGERFSLSKHSVRKALDVLVEEQLIQKNPRIGAKVRERSDEDTIILRFGCYKNIEREADIKQLLADFQEQYPHIKVQIIQLPYSPYHETVSEYIHNHLLDLFTISHADFDLFKDIGNTELFTEMSNHTELYPFLTDAFRYEEKNLVQPFVFSPIVLAYNREHFNEQDIPEPDSSWTWDVLAKTANALGDEKERLGFYFHMISSNRWPVFFLQNGFKFRKEPASEQLQDSSRFIESLNYCRDLIMSQSGASNYMSESDSDAEELFLQGKVSMIISTYYALNRFRNTDLKFDVAPLPYLQFPKTPVLITGLAISSLSKKKEAARSLIEFLMSKSSQEHIRKHTLSIPAMKKAAEWMGKEQLNRPTRFFMYREIIPSFCFLNELGLSTRELLLLRQELKLFWSRLESAEEALDRVESSLYRQYNEVIELVAK